MIPGCNMTEAEQQAFSEIKARLCRRGETLGAGVISCCVSGELQKAADEYLLSHLVLESPSISQSVSKLCLEIWNDQDQPEGSELFPGFWVVPLPINRGKRRAGYFVALLCTTDVLEPDRISMLCKETGAEQTYLLKQLADITHDSHESVQRTAQALRWMSRDLQAVMSARRDNTSFSCQLSEAYEELSLLYHLGQSMRIEQTPDEYVELTCNSLLQNLPYRFVAVRLISSRGTLQNEVTDLHMAGHPLCDTSELLKLSGRLVEGMNNPSALVYEPKHMAEYEWLEPLGNCIIAQPLRCEGQIIGAVLACDKIGDDKEVTTGEIKLLETSAGFLMIFLENAALYRDQQSLFMGTLEALTASIDAKDAYTCGHSERVAWLSRQLAAEAGFDPEVVERIYIAGLVHDVGKIGVPEAVLCKTGRLTDEEFAEIKKHPEIGARILKDVPQLQDVIPGVLYHHERIDGKGYPHGLRGYDIPVFARVIALADSFDAMSSTRTYRAALSRDQVIEEIKRCSGTQFDPVLVPHFLRLDLTVYDRMVEEHKAAGPSIMAGSNNSIRDKAA